MQECAYVLAYSSSLVIGTATAGDKWLQRTGSSGALERSNYSARLLQQQHQQQRRKTYCSCKQVGAYAQWQQEQ
jgi:hypothetical protein